MYVVFDMVLDTHFLRWSLLVCLNGMWKRRRKFGLKQFFKTGYMEWWLYVLLELADAEGSELWRLGKEIELTHVYWDGYYWRSIQ